MGDFTAKVSSTLHGANVFVTESEEGHPYISPDDIIQRPKVAYSEVTGEYHMWWHADNSTYGLLLQGLAVSESINGPYEFVNVTSPLGNYSQDFGMFTDWKTDVTYSLYSNGDSLYGRDNYITSFNEAITELDEVVYRFDKFDLEAPTIIQTEESYYILMSHKTGYRPNSKLSQNHTSFTTLTYTFRRRCSLPRRPPRRSLVSTLHYRPPQHTHI